MTTLAMTPIQSDGTEAAIDLDPRFLLIDGRDAVVTRAIQRLRLHRSEWPLAVDQGPNYFGDAPDTPAGEGVSGTRQRARAVPPRPGTAQGGNPGYGHRYNA